MERASLALDSDSVGEVTPMTLFIAWPLASARGQWRIVEKAWGRGWSVLTILMVQLIIKALISGVIIAVVSEVAKRQPGFGALIASLPLVSILGMIWLWRGGQPVLSLADHVEATFWFVLPSLPMFLLIPLMLRRGVGFWQALAAGCAVTIGLYLLMTWVGPRFGLKL
jgi:hypothetical protein